MSDKFPKEPPSDTFQDAFCDSGTPQQQCDFCGRISFDSNGEFMEEGELESLLQKSKETPDKYHPVDGGVSFGHINGKTCVYGCPCNALRNYENFIWDHRIEISDYLRRRTEDNLKAAQIDAEACGSVSTKKSTIPTRKLDR